LVATGTECRPSAGACDLAESCTGTGPSCSPDAFQPNTTECRAALPGEAGACDETEFCTGSGGDCPPNAFKPSTTECRASAGDCDVAENCPGSGPSCPSDGFQPVGTPCDSSSDTDCNNPDTCDGDGTCLENNTSDGTTCNADELVCTSDTCQVGQCVAGTPPFQKMHGSGEIGKKPNQADFGFNVKSPQPKGELNYRRKATKIHGNVIQVFYACDSSTKFRVKTKNQCEYDVTVTGNPEGRRDKIEFFSIDYVAGTGSGCADEHNAGSCEKGRIKSSKNKDDDDEDEDDH
jgi:hypothetical protein